MPDGYLVYSCPGKQSLEEIATTLAGGKQLPVPPSVEDIIERNLGHPNYRKLTPKSRPAAGRYLRVAVPTEKSKWYSSRMQSGATQRTAQRS